MVNSITISLLYSRITQFPRFPARISDCNDYRFFILFFCLLGRGSSIAFDPILCSAVGLVLSRLVKVVAALDCSKASDSDEIPLFQESIFPGCWQVFATPAFKKLERGLWLKSPRSVI